MAHVLMMSFTPSAVAAAFPVLNVLTHFQDHLRDQHMLVRCYHLGGLRQSSGRSALNDALPSRVKGGAEVEMGSPQVSGGSTCSGRVKPGSGPHVTGGRLNREMVPTPMFHTAGVVSIWTANGSVCRE